MDHAITDSHAAVTISHNRIRGIRSAKECNTDESAHTWAEGELPGLLVLFWHEEGQGAQGPRKCGPSRLAQLEMNARIGTYVPC